MVLFLDTSPIFGYTDWAVVAGVILMWRVCGIVVFNNIRSLDLEWVLSGLITVYSRG